MADEMKVEAPQPHTQLTHAIGTDRAIIMGDPARVDAIAKLMDDPQPWAFNREYKSVVGTYRGQRILAMSTGIGAPSAGIGVEELHNVGVKYVIRVGSAGAMQKDIALGANLSQVALQAALLFNAVYAQKVWNSGEADNEGGAA